MYRVGREGGRERERERVETRYSKDLQKCSEATHCQKLSIIITDDSDFSRLFNHHVQDTWLILRRAEISYNQITDSQENVLHAT